MSSTSTEKFPAAYKWLYVPFLLDTTSPLEYRILRSVDKRFEDFIPDGSIRNTWRNDLAYIIFSLRRANEVIQDDEVFNSWLHLSREKDDQEPPLCDYDLNFGMILERLDSQLYRKFLDGRQSLYLMNKLLCLLDIFPIFEKMETDNRFPGIVESMRPIFEKRHDSLLESYKARSLLLLGLLTFENPPNFSWYNELLKILATTSHTKPIARLIDPDYAEIVAAYEANLQKQIIIEFEKDGNFALADEPDSPRPQSLFETTPVDKHPADNMTLRNYQYELANKALNGNSTIICAPTGSGKTIIAAFIIRDYIRRSIVLDEPYRVVFFVPTIVLVEQQAANLRTLFGEEIVVTSLSGAETGEKKDNVLDIMAGDVIVMTPQVFINLYKSPLAKKKIYIRDFTLMVFDECHHCDKKHPYNIVMQSVLKLREKEPSKATPQIVGLTASVGVGALLVKSESGDAAVNHIMGLCARMGVLSVSCVKHPENLAQLKQMVPKPIDEFICVNSPPVDPFGRKVAELADHIQDAFNPYHKELVGEKFDYERLPTVRSTGAKNASSKTSVLYGNKLATLTHLVKESKLSLDEKGFARWLLDYLKVFHTALKYSELYPALAAYEYLRWLQIPIVDQMLAFSHSGNSFAGKMEEIYNLIKQQLDQFQSMPDVIQDPPGKKCLNRLLLEIGKQYDRDPNSRILIFVDLRRGAFDLSLYLNHHPEIEKTFGKNKVTALMSCSSNKGESFTVPSRKEQADRRTDFEQGRFNIVVSTSVCEEGVNVAACNLVIKYNSVGTEKTYIQRRGRARAQFSRSILIALGSHAEKREYLNVYREHMMERCLAMLSDMEDAKVQKLIEEDRERQVALEAGDAERRNAPTAIVDRQIRCPGCDTLLGTTNHLRVLDDETVVFFNTALWDKMKIERCIKVDPTYTSVMKCSWANCAKCPHRWGAVIKYADCFFISPRIDGISINGIHDAYKGTVKDKWSTLIRTQIRVSPLSRTELIEMYRSIFGQKENEMEAAMLSNLKALASYKKSHFVPRE